MTRRSPLLITCAVLLIGCFARAVPTPSPQYDYRQPSSRESPSRKFVLFQNPSNREGSGSARLTLRQPLGTTVWSAEFPFTFWECLVTDRGEVFGYSYSEPPTEVGGGALRIALISPRGEVLVNEIHPQVISPDTGFRQGRPHVLGLRLREDLGLGIAKVFVPIEWRRGVTQWWSYDLTTGAVRAKGEEGLPEISAFVRDGEFVPESAVPRDGESAPRRPGVDFRRLPPPLELEKLPSVKLQNEVSVKSVRDIRSWQPTDDGDLEFVRREQEEGTWSIVRIDRLGDIVSEVPFSFPDVPGAGTPDMVRLPSGHWFATLSPTRTSTWFVDGLTGEVRRLGWLPCHGTRSLTVTPGGNVVLLGDPAMSGRSKSLLCLDAGGRLLWRVRKGEGETPENFSPTRAAVTSDGLVVVSSRSGRELIVYSDTGALLRTIDLEEAVGRELLYPAGLGVDHRGNVLIADGYQNPRIWRMNTLGEDVKPFEEPDERARADGAICRIGRYASDGSRWYCDGHVFQRLGPKGHVVQQLGIPSSDQRIDEVGATMVDGSGRIVVVDERSRWAHVFDGSGARTHVGRGRKDQVGLYHRASHLTISGRGRILIESRVHPRLAEGRVGETYAVFDEKGDFVERLHLKLTEAAFVAGTETCWGWRDGHLLLVDEAGEVVRRLERRPDDQFWDARWLAAGRGRELAVIDTGTLVYYDDHHPKGRMVTLPSLPRFRRLTHGGRWIVIYGYAPPALLFDTQRYEFHLLDLAGDLSEESSVRLGFSADRTELWALGSSELLLHRYALPAE